MDPYEDDKYDVSCSSRMLFLLLDVVVLRQLYRVDVPLCLRWELKDDTRVLTLNRLSRFEQQQSTLKLPVPLLAHQRAHR